MLSVSVILSFIYDIYHPFQVGNVINSTDCPSLNYIDIILIVKTDLSMIPILF